MKKIVPIALLALSLPCIAEQNSSVERKSPYKEKVDSIVSPERTKRSFTYDDRGNCTVYTYYQFLAGEFAASSKYHFTYDPQNRISSEWSMSYENGEWIGQTDKKEYTYDGGDRKTTEISYSWNTDTKAWELSYKKEYEYTSFDSVKTSFLYRPDSETGELTLDFKIEYSYDSNNKVTEQLQLEPYMSGWSNSSKSSYINDENGNCLEKTEYYWWKSWIPRDKHSYTFNAQNQRVYYIQSSHNETEWIEKVKEERAYHPTGERATNIIYRKYGDQWQPQSKRDDTYDVHGNHIAMGYYTYNTDWIPSIRYEKSYDLTTPISDVLCPDIETYSHRPTSEAILSWNSESAQWVESQRTTFFYSPLITPIIHKSTPEPKNKLLYSAIQDRLSISLPTESKGTLTLFTLSGRALLTRDFTEKLTIDIHSLAQGMYIGRVKSTLGVQEFRFQK